MNYQKESANRRVGLALTVNAGSLGRVYLGPFAPGEYISALRLHAAGVTDQLAQGAIKVQIAAFNAPPGSSGSDTAANFAANGRPLTGPIGTATSSGLPLGVSSSLVDSTTPIVNCWGQWELPISHVVSGDERFIGVSIGVPANQGGLELSVWAIPGHSNAHDREE